MLLFALVIYQCWKDAPEIKCNDQKMVLQDDFLPKSSRLTCEELEEFKLLCMMIVQAARDEQIKALDDYAEVLLELCADSDGAVWENAKTKLGNVFDRSFLRCDPFTEFASPKEMKRYLNVILAIAKFFGDLDVNRNNLTFAENKETLTYQRLQQVVRRCVSERRMDQLAVAEECLKHWIEHIESSDGFALKAARFVFRFDMEFLPRTRPEVRVSQADALRHARSMAIGLIRCGYTPKWLDEEFPVAPSE